MDLALGLSPSPARQQALLDYVDDPLNVSSEQRAAVHHPGNFFLNACPGSGKTRTVGVRIARWSGAKDDQLGRPRRVAAASYTNTAVREILAAAERAGFGVREPSFAGTLHRFLLRYAVRPFGRWLMGCDATPKVVVSRAGDRVARASIPFRYRFTNVEVPLWAFEWRADGTLSLPESDLPFALRGKIDAQDLAARVQRDAVEGKLALARRGLMSMSDVLYWAMRVLDDEAVARTVASRFDELIVDEVQDTSDVQQVCVRRLVAAGLASVVYVGDMEQAIYGFAHADVQEMRSLITETTVDELVLTENWRSSQAICDVTHRFSSRSVPDRAVGEFADEGLAPEVILYELGQEVDALDSFRQRLDFLGIPHSDATVLCRWNSTAELFQPEPEVRVTGGLRVLVEAASAAGSGGPLPREVVQDLETLVLSFVDPEAELESLDADERLRLRVASIAIMDLLPTFDVPSKSWAEQARQIVSNAVAEFTDDKPAVGSRLRAPGGAGERTLSEILGDPAAAPAIRTIHSAKGETHTAALLLAVDSQRGEPNWTSWLGRGEPEEIRVAYVALTRARRYVALALPKTCPEQVVEAYIRRGFRPRD